MPARRSKQTGQKKANKTATKKGPKGTTASRKEPKVAASSAVPRRGSRSSKRRVPKVKASWKPVSQSTKEYVLHTFDAGVRLVTHKVPETKYRQVHDAFISARNQVAVALETARVPPFRHDYSHLSTTLVSLKELKKQLEQRRAALTDTLDSQERELQKVQDEKIDLQDFGKTPKKHHPLLLEPQEKELHLNFDSVK